MIEKISGSGNENFKAHSYCELTILATGSFFVLIDGEVQPPKKRYYLNKDQHFELETNKSVRWTYSIATISPRNEVNSGEKLVEVIEDNELSLEDRLRSEMMAKLSILADRQNLDTFEDDDDFDDDFEEDQLSHYEKKEMVEEYLIDNNLTSEDILNPKIKNSAPQEKKEETPPADPVT